MRDIYVGVIGFGTVGSGTAQVLVEQMRRIEKRVGARVVLKRVADIVVESLPEQFAGVELTNQAADIINDPDIDVVVELIGGIEPAKTFILLAIEAGKHVVTANKALLSIHGREIFDAARVHKVEVGFEASVGGGIPVIKALKEGLVANRIDSVMGIMNGTANYILTQMNDHGLPFAEVLKDAQKKGYAEADPSYDVDGIDTAHKLAILMTLAYGMHVGLDDISIEGISRIEPTDLAFAREFGYRIKLLAISRNHGKHVEGRVHPTMIPEDHLLASINGAFNGIHFTGDMVGDVLLYGQGAGMLPTGSAVVADVVDIARNILNGAVNRVPCLSFQPEHLRPVAITPIDEITGPYYFRMSVADQPGVLSTIAGILAKHVISIESVLQKGRCSSGTVPIVMVTHDASEVNVRNALDEIDALDMVTEPTVKIRIMTADFLDSNGDDE
jgi:homoserine dehydrogenase